MQKNYKDTEKNIFEMKEKRKKKKISFGSQLLK